MRAERVDRRRDLFGGDHPTSTDSIAILRDGALVGRSQAAGLIDRWVQGGVVAGGQRAGQHLAAVVLDRLGEDLEDRFISVEQPQGVGQDTVLERRVAWFAQRPTERKVAPQPTRRGSVGDLLAL